MTDVTWTPYLEIPKQGKATVWRRGSEVSTIRAGGELQKNPRNFGGDVELARECEVIADSLGLQGNPSSPAALFQKCMSPPRTTWTVNHMLAPHFVGGWQETFTLGEVPGPVFYYDIVHAYLWAGLQPLPTDFRVVREYTEPFMGLVELGRDPYEAPRPFRSEPALVTHEDIDTYGLDVRRVLRGVTWRGEVPSPIRPTMRVLCSVLPPRGFKLLTQSYWGTWAMTQPIRQQQYEDGELKSERVLPNPKLCLPWAVTIIHRVMRKLWRASRRNAVLVIVDAVMRTQRMQTGSRPGDWSLKDAVPEGVYVQGPGRWDSLPEHQDIRRWRKRSGVPKHPSEVEEAVEEGRMERRYDPRDGVPYKLERLDPPSEEKQQMWEDEFDMDQFELDSALGLLDV